MSKRFDKEKYRIEVYAILEKYSDCNSHQKAKIAEEVLGIIRLQHVTKVYYQRKVEKLEKNKLKE